LLRGRSRLCRAHGAGGGPVCPGALLMYAFYAIVAVIVTVLVLNFIEYKRVD
jgi:hypothetical protein